MTHPEASLGPLGLTSCFTNPYRRQAEFAEGKYRGQGGHRGLVETMNKEQMFYLDSRLSQRSGLVS